jgi:ABC-type amino acid transport substrate-binding protein
MATLCPSRSILSTALALTAACGLAVGCANPDDTGAVAADIGTPMPAVEHDPSIAAMLPPDIAEAGFFTAAVNPSSPPIKFLDGKGGITGFTPELIGAAADVLGVELRMQQTSFDALIPGLESRRFDIILSINDFAERRESTDFIDYLLTGTAILGAASFERESVTPETLCGVSIGFVRGNVQQGLVEKATQACAAAGAPAVQGSGFQDINAAILAVQSGQVDTAWGDAPSISYNAERNPDRYKLLYRDVAGPYGVGIHNQRPEFRDALQAALIRCVENGVYQHLLDKYGLGDYALPEMPINTGPSDAE